MFLICASEKIRYKRCNLLMCLVDQEPRRPWSPTEPEGKNVKRPRDDSFLPLVIPVSVPVRRLETSSPGPDEAALASNWPHRPPNAPDFGRADHKLSVIVTRRRSLRNSLTENLEVGTFISLVFNFFVPRCHKRLSVCDSVRKILTCRQMEKLWETNY